MDRLSSIFNSRPPRALRGALFFLALVATVECALPRLLPESQMVRLFRQVRARAAAPPAAAVEIVGDSVAHGGIFGTVLAESLRGPSVENLCMDGSGPLFTYFLLDEQIRAGAAPSVLIYAHAPHTFSGVRWPILVGKFCTWGETGRLLMERRNFFDIVDGVLARLSYTLSYREQIKAALHGDVDFFRRPKPLPSEAQRVAAFRSRSASSAPPLPPRPDIMYSNPFTVDPLNDKYIRRTLALARGHGIRVLWVTMPVNRTVYELREANGFNRDYRKFVEGLERDYGISFLQKEFLVFKDEEFSDYSHLNPAGGLRFTRLLAERYPTQSTSPGLAGPERGAGAPWGADAGGGDAGALPAAVAGSKK